MANWKRTVNIAEEWNKTRDGEMTIQELSAVIVTRLKEVEPFHDRDIDEELENLIEEFQTLAEDSSSDTDDFDEIYDRLCDWGDTKLDNQWNGAKVCWIKTF